MSEKENGLEDATVNVADSAPAGQPAGVTPEPAEMAALLEDARGKADANWDQCVRLQAEIDNLRKRSERDLANAHKFALERFAADLLPVRDSMEMGLAALDADSSDIGKLREGVELTLQMLTTVMSRFQIQEVNPEHERFNPDFHQAMSMQERADVEPNTVVTVVQKGYLLNDRLIRPAMVIVSRPPAEG
jgi:molecular chaperone GrpE